MTDLFVIGIILLLVGIAAAYIWRSKKNGAKCIGCPSGCKCSGKRGHTACNYACHNDGKGIHQDKRMSK